MKINKGFTIIELLVVIAILALLASMLMVAVSKTRVKARDSKRLSDITQIQKALELYVLDNGQYPPSFNFSSTVPTWSISNDPASWDALSTALSPYIVKLPKDPVNNTDYGSALIGLPSTYSYSYISSANNNGCLPNRYYILIYHLENDQVSVNTSPTCDGNPSTVNVISGVKAIGNLAK